MTVAVTVILHAQQHIPLQNTLKWPTTKQYKHCLHWKQQTKNRLSSSMLQHT